ncbi:MAG: lipoyl(octanoyl) transferase LipB [Moraxellaceae bacterium]|nr:lipoyl(octanoyl) transferase LipB [Pseudobdellovibrionaceae bacterium]
MKPTNNNFLFEHAFLGCLEFEAAFQIQRNLWSCAKDKNQMSIMGLEHPAVITLGRRMKLEGWTSAGDIPVIQSTRGGLATVHSEGQLVIYPVMNLKLQGLGVKEFVSKILKITQLTLRDYGIESFIDNENVGLFTVNGKIAFCGLEIKEGISQHGISINIANDLRLFSQIVSCGVTALKTDRVCNHVSDVTMRDFFEKWILNFNQSLH